MLPELFSIGGAPLPTYFAIWSLGACIIMFWASRRGPKLGLSPKWGVDLVLVVLFMGIIGARAFHILFEYPSLYRDDPARIFRLWEGGFVFYGGFFGGLGGALAYLKWRRQPFGKWLDFSAPLASLSYILGRIGCFLTGCCYGRFCRLPWAVTFPVGVEAPAGMPIHPTQIYAVLTETMTLALLLYIENAPHWKKRVLSKSGDLFSLWMMLHGIGRIIMETYRADYRGQVYLGLSLSTVISLGLIAFGALFYLRSPKVK